MIFRSPDWRFLVFFQKSPKFCLTAQQVFLTLKREGPLTQEVEYLPFKQRVVGSSPARPTMFQFRNSDFRMRIYFRF